MFASRDNDIDDNLLAEMLQNLECRKLTVHEKGSLEGPLTINELSESLKKMKRRSSMSQSSVAIVTNGPVPVCHYPVTR